MFTVFYILGIVALFIASVICFYKKEIGYGLLTGAIGGIMLFVSFFTVVSSGHVGIPVFFGEVQGVEESYYLKEGFNLVNPLLDIKQVSIRTKSYTMSAKKGEGKRVNDDGIRVLTKDGLQLYIDMTVFYRIIPNDAPFIYRYFGSNFDEEIIRPSIRDRVRAVASRYTFSEIYSEKREEFAMTTMDELQRDITKLSRNEYDRKSNLVDIQNVKIRDVVPPSTVVKAIERKLEAEQDAERMEFVLEYEQREADRKRIEAQGIQEFQEIVTKGISDKLLQWKGIETTEKLANSNNSKVIIIGSGKDGLPLILNSDK